MATKKKALKKSKLRHAEYYDFQKIQDKLYAESMDGKMFTKLVEIITLPENIKLAYRNIKKNKGSKTAGTDGKTIQHLEKLSEEKLVVLVQRKFSWYVPQSVRRVEIPKDNGKTRPLGIPTIMDRLVQQCVLQVLEPICEAKFHDHSYGFRPNRSQQHAISQVHKNMQLSHLHYVVDMLYTQLFQQLYYQADSVHGGRLPVHVHFVMDEFANVALPDEFDKLLSTMRSREISVSIIIQNLAQLKALFEKQWESIVGNCDEFLYLGGNEQSTHEYVSKLLGKETIDTNTYGRSRGRNGSYSTNYQLAGRELMTPDEVRMLDNQYALLFIRGERPIRDLKYDILHHPNVALTTDGSAPAYTHGEDTRSIASMAFSFDKKAVKNAAAMEAEKHEFLLYSEEELEELLDEKEKKDNEET